MISDYLEQHWVMLVPLIGMSILLISDIHLERRMIQRIAITNFILFIYSIFCYIETYLGNQLESKFGDRCIGIAANMEFLLICSYEENGENPELVIYKKR